MPIGTSDGQTYDNEWDHALAQTSPIMPLEATEKPAGASNSQEGTSGYENWISTNKLTPSDDYDLKAAYQAGLQPDERGHLPDTYKLPNHITFSNESVYNGKDGNEGGQWSQDANGKWSFTPGATNLKYHTLDEMKDYFKRQEPDSTLVLPHSSNGNINLSHIAEKLSETWPAKAVKGFIDAVALPHDVYNGITDPLSDEGIKRATNFALIFGTGGMDSAGKEGAVSAVKGATKDTLTTPLDPDRIGELAKSIRSGLGT